MESFRSVLILLTISSALCAENIPSIVVRKGDTALLKCSIPGNTLRLVWDREGSSGAISIGGVLQGSASTKYKITSTPAATGENPETGETLSISDVTIADTDIYRCYPLFGDSGPNVVRTNLTIATPPEYVQVQVHGDAIYEGRPTRLTCTSASSKPAAIMSWTMTMTNGEVKELQGYDTDALHPNGTTSRTSEVYVSADRSMFGATYKCIASLDLVRFSGSDDVILVMHVAPRDPYITWESLTLLEGSPTYFSCMAPDAKPPASVLWYRDGKPINGGLTTTKNPNGTFNVINKLVMTPKNTDNGAEFLCEVTNTVLQKTGSVPFRLPHKLNVEYAPHVTLDERRDTIWEGIDFDITCNFNANPNVTNVKWYQNNEVVIPGPRVRVAFDESSSKISIKNSTRKDDGDYKCEVTNAVGTTMANSSITAFILHSPVCSYDQRFQHGIKVGENVSLSCRVEAVPSSLVFFGWSVNGSDWILMEGERDPNDPTVAISIFNYTVVDQLDYTHITCKAYNGINEMYDPCVYKVREPGPAEAPTDCQVKSVNGTGAFIDCLETFDGGYPPHYWVQWEDVSGVFQTLANISHPDFSVYTLETGYNYTMRVCVSNEQFWQNISCTAPFVFQTQGVPASAATASFGHNYIIGGVVAGVVFLCLVAAIVEVTVLRKRDKKNIEEDRKLFQEVEEMREKMGPKTPEDVTYQRSQIVTDIDDVPVSMLKPETSFNDGPDPIYDSADNLKGLIAADIIKSSIQRGEREGVLQQPGLRESSVDPEGDASRILREMARMTGSHQSVHGEAQTDVLPEVIVVKEGQGSVRSDDAK